MVQNRNLTRNGKFRHRKRKMTQMAKVASKVAKRVVQRSVELKDKYFVYSSVGIEPTTGSVTSFASTGYGSASTIAALCRGISRGTNDGERVGHEISLRGVYVNFAIQNGDSYNNYRLMLIRPKGRYTTTNTQGLIQSIMSGTASSGTQWASPIDTDYYKVYWDRKINLQNVELASGDSPQTTFIQKFVKFPRGMKVQWDEQDAVPNNDVFLVAISDSVAVAHPGAIAGFVRLYYNDA